MKLPRIDIRYLYVFYCHSLPFIHKNGISENVEKRRKEIEYDLRQAYGEPDLVLRRAISLPSIITKTQEARIHRILTKCGLKYRGIPKSVSGYSEFFWYANPISSGIICYILWSNGTTLRHAIGCFTLLFRFIRWIPYCWFLPFFLLK